jgi:hypothetical protein
MKSGRSSPAGVALISTRRGVVWHDGGEVVIHEQAPPYLPRVSTSRRRTSTSTSWRTSASRRLCRTGSYCWRGASHSCNRLRGLLVEQASSQSGLTSRSPFPATRRSPARRPGCLPSPDARGRYQCRQLEECSKTKAAGIYEGQPASIDGRLNNQVQHLYGRVLRWEPTTDRLIS